MSDTAARDTGPFRELSPATPVAPSHRLASGYSSPRFWKRVAIASIASLAAGSLFAIVIIQLGGWPHGLPREILVLDRIHTRLPLLLDYIVVFLPWLGTNLVFIPVLGPACWYLWRKRRRPDLAVTIAVVTIGNNLIGTLLKFAFARPRPTLWPPRGEFSESSYPSGHAMAILSVLGVIAAILHEERDVVWPYAVWLLLLIATCYSRLYLGVHWPTDVIGGLLAGGVWFAGVLWARQRG